MSGQAERGLENRPGVGDVTRKIAWSDIQMATSYCRMVFMLINPDRQPVFDDDGAVMDDMDC